MISTESHHKNNTELAPKRIEFQMDLFESNDEIEILYKEIENLRTGLHKVRRKIFRELDEMQADVKELKEENLKLKFALYHEKDEELQLMEN